MLFTCFSACIYHCEPSWWSVCSFCMLSTLLAVLQKVFGNSRHLWREKTRCPRSFIFVPVHVIMFKGRLSAPVLMSFVLDSEQCSFAAKKKKKKTFFFFFKIVLIFWLWFTKKKKKKGILMTHNEYQQHGTVIMTLWYVYQLFDLWNPRTDANRVNFTVLLHRLHDSKICRLFRKWTCRISQMLMYVFLCMIF